MHVIDRKLMNKPQEKHWISYIKQRIRQNKNFLGFISGQTGSGKSWSSVSIAAQLDKDFSIDRIVFSGIELMELINSGKLKRGSCIVFEESGVSLASKNWYSVTNKMLNYLLQTFRHRGFILIMNSPYMDFVDASMRKLFHAEFNMIGIDRGTNEGLVKPLCIQYNSKMRKFYYKRLKVITAEGKVPVSVWRVQKPSDELINQYEQKKRAFTDKLNRDILRELQQDKAKNDKPLTENQQVVIDKLRDGLTIDQIAETLGKARFSIQESIRLAQKKGWQVTAIKDGAKIQRYVVKSPEDV